MLWRSAIFRVLVASIGREAGQRAEHAAIEDGLKGARRVAGGSTAPHFCSGFSRNATTAASALAGLALALRSVPARPRHCPLGRKRRTRRSPTSGADRSSLRRVARLDSIRLSNVRRLSLGVGQGEFRAPLEHTGQQRHPVARRAQTGRPELRAPGDHRDRRRAWRRNHRYGTLICDLERR